MGHVRILVLQSVIQTHVRSVLTTGPPGKSILYAIIHTCHLTYQNLAPGASNGKESACSAGDPGSTLGSGRSPGEGDGYPLLYSGLENSME